MLALKKRREHPILLVEDNINDVFLMQRAFEKAEVRHSLLAVASKTQAIDYLRGEGDYTDRTTFPEPALVLLDLKLPDGNGIEILEWIRKSERYGALPVVVLTSCCETPDIARAYRAGANSYIVKPASPKELEKAVRSFCDYWLKVNRWA